MSPCLQITLQDAIAAALRSDGCYVGEVASLTTQGLIDAQWAAHVAARALELNVTAVIHHEKPTGQPARAVLWVTPRPVESSLCLTAAGSTARPPA